MDRFRRGFARQVARQSPRNVHVHVTSEQVAASLCDYGEDALIDEALGMSDRQMRLVQRIAATYEDVDYPLPMEGQRITHNHVVAFAAVTSRGSVAAAQQDPSPTEEGSSGASAAAAFPRSADRPVTEATQRACVEGGLGGVEQRRRSRVVAAPMR